MQMFMDARKEMNLKMNAYWNEHETRLKEKIHKLNYYYSTKAVDVELYYLTNVVIIDHTI